MRRKIIQFVALLLICSMFSGQHLSLIAAEPSVVEEEVQKGQQKGEEKVDEEKTAQEEFLPSEEETAAENAEDQDVEKMDIPVADSQQINSAGTSESAQQTVKENLTGNIEIIKQDIQKGNFTVRVSGLSDASEIQDVRFAVWSVVGGQDDLTWMITSENKEGSYEMKVNLSDHKYAVGKYLIDVYAVLNSGEQVGIGSTECNMDIESSELEIKEKDDGQYTFTLDKVVVPGGEDAILFAVWSEQGGQDDLVWYNASLNKEGVYQYNWNVKNHKGLGKYNVHVYVRTKGNETKGLGAFEFNIATPSIGDIEIEDINVKKGQFKVAVSNVSNSELVKEIMIPVWSEQGGQDDLVWYGAEKTDDGRYELQVDIKNHKYTDGLYNIHAYITDITGYQYFSASTECVMQAEKGKIQIEKVSEGKYTITLTDLNIPGGVTEVLFPVWSEAGGQDDLVWYSAHENSDGDFAYTLDLSKHRGLGKYNVHAYARKMNGDQIPLLSTEFETDAPVIGNFDIESVDKTNGRFVVKISDIENSDLVKNIKVPVWSQSDQSDLIWYNAKRNLNGEYVAEVDIRDHHYNVGVYNVHCYVEDITGGLTGVGTTTCDMSAGIGSIEVKDQDGTEQTYTISLKGVKVPAGESDIRIAVWGEKNGQNDLVWHVLSRQSDGEYSLDIKVRDHAEMGVYNVNVYGLTQGGEMVGLGSTTFEVSTMPIYAEVLSSEVDGNKGTFRVTISGLMAPSGIQRVEMPMWCADDQSDIAWYTASKLSEGVYTVTMDVKNHGHHFGDYKVHVYVTMGNGIRVGVSSSTVQNISPSNYLYNEYVSDTQRRVWLLGVDGELVQFPTWSDANGQDDIVWYGGTNNGNGIWSVLVDSANHNSGGNYTTHAYVTKNGVRQSVGATTYSLTKVPTDQEMMRLRANSYSSTTGFIALVNRTTHKVGIFQGWQGNWNCIQYWDCSDGKTSTPTVEGVFRVGSRGHHFYSGDAICYWWTQFYGDYLFHSVLYNRYNGSLMDGRLGMGLSHGCVRLDINNAKWIYDTIPSGTTVVVYH